LRRYAFAWAYLGGFAAVEVGYILLGPRDRASLVAWASTNVANLEHEPVGPLLLSAFVTPGYLLAWLALIALAVFPANRALGSAMAALVCLAGHVMGTLVSEGIVAYRVDAGQLAVTSRYLTDVGPSYLVVSAIVIALACGTRVGRALAAADFALLVFGGHIFSGLSHLEVAAVGHLTAALTAAAATALILARRGRDGRSPVSGGYVPDRQADQVGDRDGEGPQDQLPHRAPPERPCGQPGHDAPACDGGGGGEN
jgi:hypothetical protein